MTRFTKFGWNPIPSTLELMRVIARGRIPRVPPKEALHVLIEMSSKNSGHEELNVCT